MVTGAAYVIVAIHPDKRSFTFRSQKSSADKKFNLTANPAQLPDQYP